MTKIKSITEMNDDPGVCIEFENGNTITISDNGQSCCENRYWVIDDNLNHYIGADYLGWELADSSTEDDSYDVHEIQFLNIKTSVGDINIASHNEHNGYYGGFWIEAEEKNGAMPS